MDKPLIYRQEAIEFLTVAAETCRTLEHLEEFDRKEFINRMSCLLPLLYLKGQLCPLGDAMLDGEPERFVTQADYDYIQAGIINLLGSDDNYLDVMVQDFQYSDQPITCSISENIADIYQELKDLCSSYQSAEESVMNDALVACIAAFGEHWGQKSLNALRALHVLSYDI